MKKLFTLLTALFAVAAMNAATVEWKVADISDIANNDLIGGNTYTVNSNISLTFANGDCKEGQEVKYRKVSAMPEPGIAMYSRNEMTITVTDATITSVKFQVLTDESAGSDATPGWKLKAGDTTLSAEDGDTWTGSETSLLVTSNSKTTLVGMVIEYEAENVTPVQPGEEATVTWLVSSIKDIANNDLISGNTYTVNGNLSLTFANGDCKEGQEVKYRKVSAMPEPGIAFYSKNEMTITATDAKITSVKFLILTDEGAGSDATPGWKLKAGNTTLSAEDGDTWTGSETSLLVVSNSKSTITGLEITYSADGDSGSGDDDGDDEGDDTPGDYQSAALFFSGDLVGQGEIAQNVTLSDNGTSVVFTSNSANAQIDDITFNYGSADEYDAIRYRYRPGGKSSNGVNSTNKGVFTFPCSGTLYFYCFNNQEDERSLQLMQNDKTIYDHAYSSTDYEAVTIDNEGEPAEIKVYPVYSVEVEKGTAYLLWPVNQVMISGFEFIPAESGEDDGEGEGGDQSAVEEVVIEGAAGQAYDLMGRPVGKDYRGIVIINGKKYIRK